jgi:hypothetical protein
VRQDEQAEPNMAEALERFPLTVEPWVEDPPGPSTVLEDPHPAVTPAAASDIPANSVLPETAVEQPNQAPGTPETSPAPVPLASDATDRMPPDFPTTTHLTTAMSERDAPADTATEARVTIGDRDADTNGAPHIPPPDMPLDVPLSAGPNLSAPVRLDGTTKQRHGSDDDATRTMTDSGFSVAPPGADADRLSTSVGVEGSDGTEMAEDQPRPAASPEIEDAMPAEPAPEQNEPNVVYAIGSSVPPPVTQPAGHDAVESPSNVHEVQDVMAPVTALSEVADTVAESRTEQLSDRAEAPVGAPPVHEVRYVPRPRLAPRPEPPAPLASDVDDLFADNGEDRSPQAWLARLRRAARAEAGLPPDNEETKSSLSHAPELESPPSRVSLQDDRRSVTHVEVPLSARRFLAPRLGIDPASVEIIAGPLAANVVDAHDSDAIAIGDTVILGDEPGETPVQLGLLAHELTHVARHRASRFVPPIVAADRPPQSLRGSTERDDEELAQRVEALVRSEAQAMSDPSIADPDQEPSGITSDARTTWSEAVSEQLRRPDAENGHSNWGGLPAPWEPLPAWLTEPGPELDLTSSEAQPTAGDAPTTSWQASETTARTARQDRSLQTETPHAEAHANDPRTANAEPDLDELAHQVYRVLKRRLAAEARRSQVSG